MSRNNKLAAIIGIEYCLGMLLCALLVALNVPHVVPVIIICICGSTLVSLNTRITGDTEEKKNRSIVSYSGSIKLVLLLGASFEEGYGRLSTSLLVIGFVFTSVVFFTEMLMFVKNTRTKWIKYYALVMYIFVYIIAAINIQHVWVILYCLPLLTAYSQFEDVKLVSVGVVAMNLINICIILKKYNVFVGENYVAYEEWNAIFVALFMLVYSFVLVHSTVLIKKFGDNKIKMVESDKEKIEGLAKEIISSSIAIKDNSTDINELITLLGVSIDGSLDRLENIVSDNLANIKNIEEQSNRTRQIEKDIVDLNREVLVMRDAFKVSIKDLEETRVYFEQLKNVSNIIATSNKQVVNVIREFIDNAKIVREITEGIKDISEQTNLLSLNASMESVKAGEVGRGFAVVANEIRNLAEETSKLTENIESIVCELENSSDSANTVAKDVELAVEEEVMTIDETISDFQIMETNMYELNDNLTRISKSVGSVKEFNIEIQKHIINLSASSEEVTACIDEGININRENKVMASESKQAIDAILTVVETLN